jgi:perosamine synthetase
VEFYHDELGYNYRLTNVSAAIGVGQLEQLGDYVGRKRAIAARYFSSLTDVPGIVQLHPEPQDCRSTFWMFSVLLDRPARPIVDVLAVAGITSRPLWRPMYELPAMQGACSWGDLPVTRHLCDHAISLPCSVDLPVGDQERVVRALVAALLQQTLP